MDDALTAALADTYTSIMNDAAFLEELKECQAVPLRKNSDSPEPFDYRLITMLMTSYKVFTAILASCLQRHLGALIGDTQQGFVRGRQIEWSVVLMQAVLATAERTESVDLDDSLAVVLLDVRKAYDKLDQPFLLTTLRKFGFREQFVRPIERMRTETKVRFVVNGESSERREVRSGIRQCCPLAPLLFILAADTLALAVQKERRISGTRLRTAETEHKISAFVDDSAVFLG